VTREKVIYQPRRRLDRLQCNGKKRLSKYESVLTSQQKTGFVGGHLKNDISKRERQDKGKQQAEIFLTNDDKV